MRQRLERIATGGTLGLGLPVRGGGLVALNRASVGVGSFVLARVALAAEIFSPLLAFLELGAVLPLGGTNAVSARSARRRSARAPTTGRLPPGRNG